MCTKLAFVAIALVGLVAGEELNRLHTFKRQRDNRAAHRVNSHNGLAQELETIDHFLKKPSSLEEDEEDFGRPIDELLARPDSRDSLETRIDSCIATEKARISTKYVSTGGCIALNVLTLGVFGLVRGGVQCGVGLFERDRTSSAAQISKGCDSLIGAIPVYGWIKTGLVLSEEIENDVVGDVMLHNACGLCATAFMKGILTDLENGDVEEQGNEIAARSSRAFSAAGCEAVAPRVDLDNKDRLRRFFYQIVWRWTSQRGRMERFARAYGRGSEARRIVGHVRSFVARPTGSVTNLDYDCQMDQCWRFLSGSESGLPRGSSVSLARDNFFTLTRPKSNAALCGTATCVASVLRDVAGLTDGSTMFGKSMEEWGIGDDEEKYLCGPQTTPKYSSIRRSRSRSRSSRRHFLVY